jgi:hypothetical protein
MGMDVTPLVDAYLAAKEIVIARGYGAEIDWQRGLCFDRVTESAFLAEAAWVVLSCGMREAVVRKTFAHVSAAFYQWESAGRIAGGVDSCVEAALPRFNHRGKITAIARIACQVDRLGFGQLKEEIARRGVARLREFPYMGPATSYHLAKNLGMDVTKPDRHLIRIAEAAGYGSPDLLCSALANAVGDRVAVVDLVLWRYATLASNYSVHFAGSTRPVPAP